MLLRGVPCWSVNGAEHLALIVPPEGVKRLIAFADPDLPGRNAAEATRAAHPGLQVDIRFPEGAEG